MLLPCACRLIQLFRLMGPEAFAMFRHHDSNNDGALSAREFEPLAHILVDVNVSVCPLQQLCFFADTV